MNHKPRTRLAAMLLACLLLCPSPGRSEAERSGDTDRRNGGVADAGICPETGGNAGRGSGTRSEAYGSTCTSYTGTYARANRGSTGRGNSTRSGAYGSTCTSYTGTYAGANRGSTRNSASNAASCTSPDRSTAAPNRGTDFRTRSRSAIARA